MLHTRPGSVLLLDEPDAHLHVILQDAIYGELRRVAAAQDSQLVVATHAEVVINAVDPSEICVLFDHPRPLADSAEKGTLIRSLGALSNADIMLAARAPGILYTEDRSDVELLRAWARTLNHPAHELLTTQLFWRKSVGETRPGGRGIPSKDHFAALRLVRPDIPGLELLDRDGNPHHRATSVVGKGLVRLRWRRYEIESYLVHPAALDRFVQTKRGGGEASATQRADMARHIESVFQPEFVRDPLRPTPLVASYLDNTKARTLILPPILTAGGLPAFSCTDYHEIAAEMRPEEIHPEVVEKLDALCKAFGVPV
jgi:hypothetical protein